MIGELLGYIVYWFNPYKGEDGEEVSTIFKDRYLADKECYRVRRMGENPKIFRLTKLLDEYIIRDVT